MRRPEQQQSLKACNSNCDGSISSASGCRVCHFMVLQKGTSSIYGHRKEKEVNDSESDAKIKNSLWEKRKFSRNFQLLFSTLREIFRLIFNMLRI